MGIFKVLFFANGKKRHKNKILDLRPKQFVFSITWRNIPIFLKKHAGLTVVLLSLITIGLFAVRPFFIKASVAVFYPASCLGGWENVHNAEGEPQVSDNNSASFNEQNSAYLNNRISQIFCGNFKGALPQNTKPQKIMVRLSWAVGDKTALSEVSGTEMSSAASVETSPSASTSSDVFLIDLNEDFSSSARNAENPILNGQNAGTSTDVSSSTPIEEPAVSADAVVPVADAVSVEDVSLPAEDTVSTEDANSAETSADNPIEVSMPDEVPDTSVPQDDPPEQVDSPTSFLNFLTPKAYAVDQIDETAAAVDDSVFTILYTLDGKSWNSLGSVTRSEIGNKEFEIPTDNIQNWEDLSNVQINIQSAVILEQDLTVYLDGISLDVSYDEVSPYANSRTISTHKIVAGLPTQLVSLVDTNEIKSGKYLVKIPKSATNITIKKITPEEIRTIQNNRQKDITADQRSNLAKATAAEADASKTFFGSVSGKMDSVLDSTGQTIKNITSGVFFGDDLQLVDISFIVASSSDTSVSSIEMASSTLGRFALEPCQGDESDDCVAVQYNVPAPVIKEKSTSIGQLVTVSAKDEVAPLTDVVAYVTIPKMFKVGESSKIQIKWKNNDNLGMPFSAYDTDADNYLDYIEWTVPHLSDQTFEIIYISKAFHLDRDQNIVADIYDQVKRQDDSWATVGGGEYVRATFFKVLDETKDNTVYAKPTNSKCIENNSCPTVEVYPVYVDADGNQIQGSKIATFPTINREGTYKVLLTGLETPTDTFDLRVTGGSVDIDFVVDPMVEATIIEFKHKYPAGTTIAFTETAEVGDVIVLFGEAASQTHLTATDSLGSTYGEQAFRHSGATHSAITCLTAMVTTEGVPSITTNSLSDLGLSGWIVRNLSSNVAHQAGSNAGVGTLLTIPLETTVPSSLFMAYSNEASTASFTSFTDEITTTDNRDVGHSDAHGHTLNLEAGSYAPGANLVSSAENVIMAVYLPNQVTADEPTTDAYWVGGTGNWSDATNHWAATSGGAPGSDNLPGTTTVAHFDSNSGTGTVTINTAGVSVAGLDHSKSDITIATGGNGVIVTGDLTVEGTISGATAVTLSGTGKTIYGAGTVSAPIILSANYNIDTSSTTLALSGAISGVSRSLTTVGTGTVTLSAANTFTGGLIIKSGTVIGKTSTSAFGGSGTGTITIGNSAGGSDDATLRGDSSSTFANPILLASNATGTLTVGTFSNVAPTFSGGVTGNNNLTIDNMSTGGNILTFSAATINNVGTVTNASTGSNAPVAIGAVIGTNVTGVIQNSSTSVMTLSASNTFTSGLTILKGTVAGITSASAFGSVTGGGTNGRITIGNSAGGSDDATLQGGATLTYANPILLASNTTGTLKISTTYSAGAGVTPTFSGGVTGNNNLVIDYPRTFGAVYGITFSGVSVNNAGTITNASTGTNTVIISAVIGTNVTGVIQNSEGNLLVLSASNTFTSGLTILKGVVRGQTSVNAFGSVTGGGTNGRITIGNSAGGSDDATLQAGSNLTFANPILLASNTTGTLMVGTYGNVSSTFSGGVTGNNNLVIKNDSASANPVTFSTGAINNVGTVTNVSTGTSAGGVLITAVIGTNVTGVIQNSTMLLSLRGNNTFTGDVTILKGTVRGQTSASAFGAGTITIGNSAGGSDDATLNVYGALVIANPIVLASNTTGTLAIGNLNASPTLSGGITGNNNLTINSTAGSTLIFSVAATIDNVGTITNISSASTLVRIDSVIGSNVTEVIQDSVVPLTFRGNNAFGALTIKKGMVNGETSASAFGAGTITIGNSAGGSDDATLRGGATLTYANPIVLASNTTGKLSVYNNTAYHPTFSGGVTGNNNLTIESLYGYRTVYFSGEPINNVGSVTVIRNALCHVNISSVIGSNVTELISNGIVDTSALTLSGDNAFGALIIKSGVTSGQTSATAFGAGTITIGNSAGGSDDATLHINSSLTYGNPIVLAPNTTGTLLIENYTNYNVTFTGGVTGNNNLTINNTGTWGYNVTFSDGSLNNVGTITNIGDNAASGGRSNPVVINSVIGPNVTGLIQNSSTHLLTLSGNNSTISGDVTIATGTLELAGTTNINVTGNWSNTGTFTANQGKVTFNGAGAQSISGANTWYGLAVTGTTSRTVSFESGVTQTIAANGSLTFTGAANNLLSLAPITPTTPWKLAVSTTGVTQNISYTTPSYSDASGSASFNQEINATGVGNVDGDNNTNWAFGGTVSCSVNQSATSFGVLDIESVNTSDVSAYAVMTCASAGGCTLFVQGDGNGSDPGLYAASATGTPIILSSTATLSAGTEGYGIQAATTTAGSGATLTLSSIYFKSGNAVGGLTTAATAIASSTSPVTDREVVVTHKAAISGNTLPGSYSDTITYSCVGN